MIREVEAVLSGASFRNVGADGDAMAADRIRSALKAAQ